MSLLVSAFARPFSEVGSQASELGNPDDEIFSEFGDRTLPPSGRRRTERDRTNRQPQPQQQQGDGGQDWLSGLFGAFQPKADDAHADGSDAAARPIEEMDARHINKMNRKQLFIALTTRIGDLRADKLRMEREMKLAQDALTQNSRELARIQAQLDDATAHAHELEQKNTMLQLLCSIGSLLALSTAAVLLSGTFTKQNN